MLPAIEELEALDKPALIDRLIKSEVNLANALERLREVDPAAKLAACLTPEARRLVALGANFDGVAIP